MNIPAFWARKEFDEKSHSGTTFHLTACGSSSVSFPRTTPEQEAHFRKWEADYSRIDAGYRVCEFIEQVGPDVGLAEIETVTAAHDRGARVSSSAPLA